MHQLFDAIYLKVRWPKTFQMPVLKDICMLSWEKRSMEYVYDKITRGKAEKLSKYTLYVTSRDSYLFSLDGEKCGDSGKEENHKGLHNFQANCLF